MPRVPRLSQQGGTYCKGDMAVVTCGDTGPGDELHIPSDIMFRYPDWGSHPRGSQAATSQTYFDIILASALVPVVSHVKYESAGSSAGSLATTPKPSEEKDDGLDILSRNLTESASAFSTSGESLSPPASVIQVQSLAVGERIVASDALSQVGLLIAQRSSFNELLPVPPIPKATPPVLADQEGLLPLPPPSQQLFFTKPQQTSVTAPEASKPVVLPGPVPNIAAKPFVPKPMALLPSEDQYICRGCSGLFDGISPMTSDRRPYIVRIARHVDRRLSKILRRTGPPSDTDRSVILLRFDLLPDPHILNHCVWTAMREARYCADCVMKEVTLQARPVNVLLKDSVGFPDEVLHTDMDGRRVVLPHLLLPASAAKRVCNMMNEAWRISLATGIPWTFSLVDPGVRPRPITAEDYAKLFE